MVMSISWPALGCAGEVLAGADSSYRLLVSESGVEGVGAGVGLLPDDQVRQPFRVQNTLL